MKKIKKFLQIMFGLTIIASIGFLLFKIVLVLIDKIDKINANIFVALIAGTVTIIGFFITRYLEKRKLIEQQIREQKLPAYEEFVDFLFNIFKQTKDGKALNEKELGESFWEMNKKSILWLSDKTLKSYSLWKNMSIKYTSKTEKNESDNLIIFLALERLLLDFREDIGHRNKDIKDGDILKLFINDWDNYSAGRNN